MTARLSGWIGFCATIAPQPRPQGRGIDKMRKGSPRPGPRPQRRKLKPCRGCGAMYWGRKHGYCSPECGEAARAEHLARAEITEAVKAGLAASPITQRDEKNHGAKNYSLLAPDGTLYRFRNLAHFVREHHHLFAPEDVAPNPARPTSLICRATVGLGQLRPGRKLRRKTESWKGWRWAANVKDRHGER